MRDWSKLINQISHLTYAELVEDGKKITATVLSIIEKKTEDPDSAFMILAGLAAMAVVADNEISDSEMKLINDAIGITEKDFKNTLKETQKNPAFVKELSDSLVLLDNEEVEDFAHLMMIIFFADGDFSDKEYAFIRDICR